MRRRREDAAGVPERGERGSPWFAALGALCLLAWAAWVLKAHYESLGVRGPTLAAALPALLPRPWPADAWALLRHGKRLLGLGWLIAAAWSAGRLASGLLKVAWTDPFEKAAVRFGLGLGALAYAVLALGLCGLLYVPVILSLLAALSAAGLRGLEGSEAAPPAAPPAGDADVPWRPVFACLLTAAAVAGLPFLLAPETFWDALVYHLNLPTMYLLRHRVFPTPANLFSGNALSIQMLFTAALAVEGPVLAKLLNWSMGLAHALIFASWARRWGRPGAGLLATAFFFLSPLVLYESYRTSVGLGWSFFQLCAFHSLMTACGRPEASRERGTWWLLAGLFLGLAMSTKYPAWLLAPMPLLAAALSRVRRLSLPVIHGREAILATAVSVVMLLPWVLRNAAFYHDPVFPYLTEAYAPGGDGLCDAALAGCSLPVREDKGWRAMNQDARSRDVRATVSTIAGIKRYLVHPWAFSTKVVNRQADFIGPLFLILLPLALLRSGAPPLLGVLVLGAWLPLSLISEMPRFFLPTLAPLSFLLASAVAAVRRRWARHGLRTLCAAVLTVNVLMTFHPPPEPRGFWDVVSGRTSEAEFLTHGIIGMYPNPPYAGLRFINERLRPGAKVLLVGDARGVYAEKGYFSSGQFDVEIMERLLNCGESPAAVAERLRRCGVTHILVNRAEFYRLKQSFHLTAKGDANYRGFWQDRTEKVFESYAPPADHWVAVFRVLDEGEPPAPAKTEPMLIGPKRD
ncbi:MAG: glycosyltransferase family 39 protein [Elusimicrobia bacterium]|nr:glycosyltransferase family 39 protein [Elusimicrobiota bacterium]